MNNVNSFTHFFICSFGYKIIQIYNALIAKSRTLSSPGFIEILISYPVNFILVVPQSRNIKTNQILPYIMWIIVVKVIISLRCNGSIVSQKELEGM